MQTRDVTILNRIPFNRIVNTQHRFAISETQFID